MNDKCIKMLFFSTDRYGVELIYVAMLLGYATIFSFLLKS